MQGTVVLLHSVHKFQIRKSEVKCFNFLLSLLITQEVHYNNQQLYGNVQTEPEVMSSNNAFGSSMLCEKPISCLLS